MVELSFKDFLNDDFPDTDYKEVDPLPSTPAEAILPNGKVRVRRKQKDDYRDFPTESEVGFENRFARSGIVRHAFFGDAWLQNDLFRPTNLDTAKSYPARYSLPYNDEEVDFECLNVLKAHGWVDERAGVSDIVLDIIKANEPACFFAKAKLRFRNNWKAFAYETAACYEALPLSRLWYVANIYSLYYCHHDDLRAGYLWAEYRLRLSAERKANCGEKVLKAAKRAGAQRSDQHRPTRERRLARMSELVPKIGRDKAAAQCECEGLGKLAAIKRQWNRHKSGT